MAAQSLQDHNSRGEIIHLPVLSCHPLRTALYSKRPFRLHSARESPPKNKRATGSRSDPPEPSDIWTRPDRRRRRAMVFMHACGHAGALDNPFRSVVRLCILHAEVLSMTSKELRALFDEFNGRYFDGRLPPCAIRTGVKLRARDHVAGWCHATKPIIMIRRVLSKADSIGTLLHEMVHAAVGPSQGHNKRWALEMVRIQELGASFTGDDLDLKMMLDIGAYDGPVNRPTKGDFGAVTADVLSDRPGTTFTMAVRWYMHSHGAPVETVADFVARYPWAKAVYREERRILTVRRRDEEMWRLMKLYDAGEELTPEQTKALARWSKQMAKIAQGSPRERSPVPA